MLIYKCTLSGIKKYTNLINDIEVKIIITKIDEAIIIKQFQLNELSDLPKLRMIMKTQQMKPKFSLLARELQVNRRTV